MGARNRWHSLTNPALNAWAGEVGTADEYVMAGRRLQLPDRFRVEVPLDLRLGSGDRLQRPGVHDLVGRLPYPSEVPHEGRLGGEAGIGLPNHHRLVHPASVEMGASRTFEVVGESMHLLIRHGPVEFAGAILYIAIK